jgi:hypothetical protein
MSKTTSRAFVICCRAVRPHPEHHLFRSWRAICSARLDLPAALEIVQLGQPHGAGGPRAAASSRSCGALPGRGTSTSRASTSTVRPQHPGPRVGDGPRSGRDAGPRSPAPPSPLPTAGRARARLPATSLRAGVQGPETTATPAMERGPPRRVRRRHPDDGPDERRVHGWTFEALCCELATGHDRFNVKRAMRRMEDEGVLQGDRPRGARLQRPGRDDRDGLPSEARTGSPAPSLREGLAGHGDRSAAGVRANRPRAASEKAHLVERTV